MKNTKIFLTVIALLFHHYVNAQLGENITSGARGVGMSNATLGFEDVHAVINNQAGLAYVEHFSGTVGVHQSFGVHEIKRIVGLAALPTISGVFGFSIQYYGFELYNEQKIGLSYGRKIFEKLAIGTQISYLRTSIKNYGNLSLISFDLGLTAEVSEQISIHSHIVNPIRVVIVDDQIVNTIIRFGGSYRPSEKLFLTVQADKVLDHEFNILAGIEYHIIDILTLRVGGGSRPASYSFGVGLNLRSGLGIDIGFGFHQELQFSPAFGVSYIPGELMN